MEQDVYNGQYIRVTEEPRDGHIYERVHIRSGVSIIPITENGRIRFVREVSWDNGEIHTKLVSGYVEDGETPLDCARRELREELGLEAYHWELFDTYHSEESTVQKTQSFFIARNTESVGEPNLEPGEQVVGYVDLPPNEIRTLLLSNAFGTTPTALVLSRFIEGLGNE